MIRSRLVLPEPEGPTSATSSPVGTCRLTSFTATKGPNLFVTPRTSIDTGVLRVRQRRGAAPLDRRLDRERHQREEREERRDREGGLEVVFVVEDLDVRSEEHTSELQSHS